MNVMCCLPLEVAWLSDLLWPVASTLIHLLQWCLLIFPVGLY